MIGVFLVNVYIGLADENLRSGYPSHYYVNWGIAVVSLIAALLLLARPGSRQSIAFAGIIWPILYVLALVGDVYTRLCAGASPESCWPTKTAAFDYLILNQKTVLGTLGYGWKIAPVVPVAIVFLAIIFVISLAALIQMGRRPGMQPALAQPPAASTPSMTVER
jgi:hypothetical protein